MLKRDDDMHDRPASVSSAGNLQDMVGEDSYHGPSTNNDSNNSTESGSDNSSAVSTQPPPVPVRKNTGDSGDHDKKYAGRQNTSTSRDPPEIRPPPPPPYQTAQRPQRHSASHLEDLYQYQQLTGLRRATSHGQQQQQQHGGGGSARGGRKSASHIDQMYEVMQQQEQHQQPMRKQPYHHGPHIGHHPPTSNNKDQQQLEMLNILLNSSESDILLFDNPPSPKEGTHAFHHSEGALNMAYNPRRNSQHHGHSHNNKNVGGEKQKKGENKKKKKQHHPSSSSSSKQKQHHTRQQRSKSSDMISGLDNSNRSHGSYSSNRSHGSYSSNYSEVQSVNDYYNMDIPSYNKQKSGGSSSGGKMMNENLPEAQPSSSPRSNSSHDIYPMGGGSNNKKRVEGGRSEGSGTKGSGRRQRSPHPVREFTDPSASSQHDHKHQGQGKGHHGSSGGVGNKNMKHPHQPSKKKSHSSSHPHHHSHHHAETLSSSTNHSDPPTEDESEPSGTYSNASSNAAQCRYIPTRKHHNHNGGTSATPRSGPTDSPQKLSLDSLKFSSSNNDETKQNARNTTFNSDGSAITVHTLDSYDAQKLQTAEQLRDLIELMQAEFQKLKQAKDSAEMKAQTLETDISRMEQEHDAEFVKLSSDCEHWKNMAQQEQARYDSVVHKMDRLEAENDTMKLQWSKAIKSKSEMDEKVVELENKNHALKKLLKKVDRTAYKKYKKDSESSNHEKKKGEKDSSSTIPTKMDSSHGDCSSSALSLALSVATASKVLETGGGERYDTPPMTIETMMEALHHGQTQNQHNAANSPSHLYQQHEDVGEAPASWHPGKKTKSLRKMPEISLPLN